MSGVAKARLIVEGDESHTLFRMRLPAAHHLAESDAHLIAQLADLDRKGASAEALMGFREADSAVAIRSALVDIDSDSAEKVDTDRRRREDAGLAPIRADDRPDRQLVLQRIGLIADAMGSGIAIPRIDAQWIVSALADISRGDDAEKALALVGIKSGRRVGSGYTVEQEKELAREVFLAHGNGHPLTKTRRGVDRISPDLTAYEVAAAKTGKPASAAERAYRKHRHLYRTSTRSAKK